MLLLLSLLLLLLLLNRSLNNMNRFSELFINCTVACSNRPETVYRSHCRVIRHRTWIRTLVAADIILDRPPSDACVSAMQASGDQCTATVPMSASAPDKRHDNYQLREYSPNLLCLRSAILSRQILQCRSNYTGLELCKLCCIMKCYH